MRGIFTTVTKTFDRIAIHFTPRWVLKLQSERLGLPLYEIAIPSPCTNAQNTGRITPAANPSSVL